MIQLTANQITAIRQHGESDYPHECCGIVLGHFAADGSKTVSELLPISNAREEEARHNRFLITAADMLRGEKRAMASGLDVIGFYHSHPDHPAVPSQFDLDHAWPIYSYLIVSVIQGQSDELTSWELVDDRSRFEAEPLVEVEGE
jgi:proteasome lid subunit RPN8/RPN11